MKLKGSFLVSPATKTQFFSRLIKRDGHISIFPASGCCWRAHIVLQRVSRPPPRRAELMTSGPLEQRFRRLCNTALIAFAAAGPHNGSGGVFPPGHKCKNPSSLSRISVAPTQLYCHPISLNLWADNSRKRHTLMRLFLRGRATGAGIPPPLLQNVHHSWKM